MQVSRCTGLSGSDRKFPALTGRSGTCLPGERTHRSVGVGNSSRTVRHRSQAGPIFQSCPGAWFSRASVVHKSPRLLPALWHRGMTRQPRPSRVYHAPPFSGRLAVTAPRAWPPHNCPHSPWRGAHMGPAGQVSCTAGCGWGFDADADLIPVHSPTMSRTRMIHPIPIHRFAGFLGGSGDRFGSRCASR